MQASRIAFSIVLLTLLSACGGGGSSTPSANAPDALGYNYPVSFTVNVPINALTPTVVGTVESYGVSPPLPAGLILNTASGVISGTPTALSSTANYTVTASNARGSTSVVVPITVNDAAPRIAYASSSLNTTVGAAVNLPAPTNTGGAVTIWSFHPALPQGLSFDSVTGALTGIPTAPIAQTTFVVRAQNSGGVADANLSITVNDAPPNFSYATSTLRWTTGVPVNVPAPTNTGGAATLWSILPALPQGVTLNASTGALTGTPTAATPQASYVVTASNAAGSAAVTLSITVTSAVLVDLGHRGTVSNVQVTSTRVLSYESEAWILWDYTSRARLARGAAHSQITPQLKNNTFLVRLENTLEARDAATGALLISLPAVANTWGQLAEDGSYFVVGSGTGIVAYSRNGVQRFSRGGNYTGARAFVSVTEIRIARGPAGADVIERLDSLSGVQSLGATYLGSFHSWFNDGMRFLTTVGNTVRVYSLSGVQEGIVALPNITELAGTGDYFWISDSASGLAIYRVGTSTPALTQSLASLQRAVNSGSQIAVLEYGSGGLRVFDLGATITSTLYSTPVRYLNSFASLNTTQWLVGAERGVLFDGATIATTPQYYGHGAALDIAASTTRIVIATAAQSILVYDSATRTLEQTIDFVSSDVSISADGTRLAAMASTEDFQYRPNRSIRIYSLPDGALLSERPNSYPTIPRPIAIELSTRGTLLAEYQGGTGSNRTRVVSSTLGGAIVLSDTVPDTYPPLLISPGESFVAAPTIPAINGTTNLYENGVLKSALPAWTVMWLNDDALLVNLYRSNGLYANSAIYNRAGILQRTVTLSNDVDSAQLAGNDRIYAPTFHKIYSLVTGLVVWTSATPSRGLIGTISGNYVVFSSLGEIRMEPID